MTAIVPVRTEKAAPLVSLAAGGVGAMLRIDGFDRGLGLVWYVLQLGGIGGRVRGCVIGVLRDGKEVELGRLDVAAGAVGESRFAVPQRRRDRFAHVYLDLLSTEVVLRLEAPSSPIPQRASVPRYALALLAAGTLVAGGGILALAFPRPPLMTGPLSATAGATAHVLYETRGLGNAHFAATTDEGRVLAGGSLSASQGDIAIAIPPGLDRRRVRVRVDMAGPFGKTASELAFGVVPPIAIAPPGPLARIASFSARRDGGEGVLASYLAVGEQGRIVVTDATGRVVGSAPFSRGGTTRIPVSSEAARALLGVRLDVRRGDSRATAALELSPLSSDFAAALAKVPAVVPVDASAEPPNAGDAPASFDDGPQSPVTASGADDPFALLGTAVAGRPLTVLIRRELPGMHLRLADDVGTTVAEVPVPAGAQRVALTPPAATAAQTYYLTCTYGSGNAEEVIVRSVRVSAH